ncbi:MAG: hypothetical protein WCH62_08060, partial [Candidatus Omnitrophota bacterium]
MSILLVAVLIVILIILLKMSKSFRLNKDAYDKQWFGINRDSSYIRRWTEDEMKRVAVRTDGVTVDGAFIAIIYGGLLTFIQKGKKTDDGGLVGSSSNSTELSNALVLEKIEKDFRTDCTLFEVGCYLFFKIDLWLLKNKPDVRRKVFDVFAEKFIELFTKA